MAHQSQRDFVQAVASRLPGFFRDVKVLEVGSLNINGTVRDFFSNCDYTGIDVAPGKDVDVVCQGQDFNAEDGSFDQVISCEAMEHNPYWKETISNMIRVCRPGGLITLTCATTGRPEHGTTRTSPWHSPLTVDQGWDYYQNLKVRDFIRACDLNSAFTSYRFWVNWTSFDLFMIGLKISPDFSPIFLAQWDPTLTDIDQLIATANNRKICKYRSVMAKVGGDQWFVAMRDLAEKMDFLHNV
ncbi:MAG: class I SAM-dependent methyltransferase [Cyanobacteriota bacterium]|nr:class I SAM-dependent methyltransferase [Cyanobacteriota bacterium]